jgi:acetyl-CoA carboxylase carboxyl transferase subunit beta
MSWFRKEKRPRQPVDQKKGKVPEGLWTKCDSCGQIIYKKEIARNANVCPKCGYHFRISSRARLEVLYDGGLYEEFDAGLISVDPLGFVDTKAYRDRIEESRERTGHGDAVINTQGTIGGIHLIISAMEYAFMGGSMGSVVGEKITRAVERAIELRVPLIIISCSGGARMQEGALSLMQMAKISAGLANMHQAGIPYVSILTDPTTGGVTASFAMLGDLNIAEPRALIGFAGPRVIEQTIRQTLPEGFQRAEFLIQHGMLDLIVERAAMRDALIRILRLLHDPALAANAVYAAQVAEEEAARKS